MYAIVIVSFFFSDINIVKNNWRHETECYGYLLLFIASYILYHSVIHNTEHYTWDSNNL